MKINLDSKRINNFTDLMRELQRIVYSVWGKDRVSFTAAYPNANTSQSLTTPIITYKIVEKVPGAINKTQEIKPRIRDTIKVEDHKLLPDGEVDTVYESVDIYGQLFDYTVAFEIWAEDGEEADRLAEEFQRFLFKYIGYLKKIGASEIIFRRQTSDDSSSRWKAELMNRVLLYQIRIDEVVGAKNEKFEGFVIDSNLHKTSFHLALELSNLSNSD